MLLKHKLRQVPGVETLSLWEGGTILSNKKLWTCSILSFSNFKLLSFFLKRHSKLLNDSSIYYYHGTSNNEHDWNPVKYLNVFITIEYKSSCNTFFLIYCKNFTSFLFWVLGHVWLLPSKMIMPTCRSFDIYLHVKNELHS